MKARQIQDHNNIMVAEACYEMTTPELRLIYSCVSKIGFDETIKKEQSFFISAAEYSEAFGVGKTNVYREMKEAADGVWGRQVVIQRENDIPLTCRWVDQAQYYDGVVEITFTRHVIPYLAKLRERGSFAIHHLENIGSLKSFYSIRMYELLIQYKAIGSRKMPLNELKKALSLDDKYKTMCNLKNRVVDPAIYEINAHTDIKVSYENIKEGRSIIGFEFTINTHMVMA